MFRKILSCAVVLLSSTFFGWEFYLVRSNGEIAETSGLLIATEDSTLGTVCDDYFDDNAAAVICKDMGFSGSDSWNSGELWSMQFSYAIQLDNIRCHSPNQTFDDCLYSEIHNCGHAEDVFLSCKGCSIDYYTVNDTCTKCPAGSTSEANSENCNCTGGSHWDTDTLTCLLCPENTYSKENSTHCTPCPENSSSRPGAEQCDCDRNFYKPGSGEECWKCPPDTTSTPGSTFCSCTPGLFFSLGYCQTCPSDTYSPGNVTECETCPAGSSSLPGAGVCECSGGLFINSSGLCEPCSGDSYSYKGSSSCTPCPGNYTSRLYQSYCECPAGMFWNYPLRNCVECPPDHYNHQTNQTRCRECPEHAHSQSGSEGCSCNAGYKLLNLSLHCEMCPENHFSRAGSLSCQPCPNFKIAAAGSDRCYRCTLGQYWENDTCIQCPDHLYGDGVQCLECPGEFQVDQGLCFKVADKNSLANLVQPLETAIIALGSLLLFVYFAVVGMIVWNVHSSRLRKKAGNGVNVDQSELQRLQPAADEDVSGLNMETDLEENDTERFGRLYDDHDKVEIDVSKGERNVEDQKESGSETAEVESNIYEDI